MKPTRQKPDYSAIKTFIEAVQKPINERFAGRLISRSHLPGIQRDMDREWKAFYWREPGPYLLAEGCSVDGLEAALHYGALMLRWRTLFIPGPRYKPHHGGGIPLGFFREFDLYAAYQYPTHASVIAVHADGRTTEWHLHRHNVQPPQENAAAINQALRRAGLVNAFFGSQFARPQPLGRAALPVRRTR